MADKKIQLTLELQNGQYISSVREVSRETEKFRKKAQDVGSGAAAGFQKMYNAAKMFIGVQMVRFLLDLTGRFDDVKTSFENLTSSMAGGSQALLKSIQTAAKGTVSQLDIMKSSNLAISLMGENVAQYLPKMMEIAVATAQNQGVTVAQMYNDIIVASGRQSVMILDNLGISSVTAGKYMEEYAQQLGKTRMTLNDTEKSAAFFYAVMKAGGEFIDKNGQSTLTFGQRLQVIKSRTEDAAISFTQKLIPGLEQVTKVLTETDLGQDSLIDQIGDTINDIIVLLSRFIIQMKAIPSMTRQAFKDAKAAAVGDDKVAARTAIESTLGKKYNDAVKNNDKKAINEVINYYRNNKKGLVALGYDDAYLTNQIQLMELESGYSAYNKGGKKDTKSSKTKAKVTNAEDNKTAASDAAKNKYEDDQKYLQSFRQATMSEYEIIQDNYNQEMVKFNSITDEKLKATEEYGKARAAIEKKYQDQISNYIIDKGLGALSMISSGVGQINELYNMSANNRIMKLDAQYAKEVEIIEKSTASEEEKENRLAMLEANFEAKKKKIQLENAKKQKKFSIFQALLEVPAAAISTFRAILMPNAPWTVPLAWAGAAAATGLAMAKVKLIKDQPLPALAAGGLVTDPTFALLGEGKYPESVLPHSDKTFDALGEGIERARTRNSAAASQTIINNYSVNVQGSVIDKEGFNKGVHEGLLDIQQRTGVDVYSRKSVWG